MRYAACHPDKKHRARDLCSTCYRRWKQRSAYKRKNGGVVRHPGVARFAQCHPDRRYCAKGLCAPCYVTRRASRLLKTDPTFKATLSERARVRYETTGTVRDALYRKKYGITIGDYGALSESQNGLCAICLRTDRLNRRLAVDHNHATKKVRGLLCGDCNYFVGKVETRGAEYMIAVLSYLKKHDEFLLKAEDDTH